MGGSETSEGGRGKVWRQREGWEEVEEEEEEKGVLPGCGRGRDTI